MHVKRIYNWHFSITNQQCSQHRPGLPLSFLNWAYVRQGGLFWGVWYARSIDFRRFSYAKPSDFWHNFYIDSIEWLTTSDG